MRSAVELVRSNRTFRSKVKVAFVFAEDEEIYAVSADVEMRLDSIISENANGC